MLRLTLAALVLAASASAQVNYSKEVSRIFRAKCEGCHREGDIAPFALNDYDAAVTWAADIRRVINANKMPPWKPVPGHGDFKDSLALSEEERSQILDWIANEMPQGDPADLPEPLENKSEWPLGTPDVEMRMLQSYTPPRGSDVYRCFVIPTDFDETKYLSAIDVIPGNRQIVHHVLLFQDTSGTAEKLEGQDGQPGYTCFGGPGFEINLNNLTAALGGWAPGQRTRHLPDGIGLELNKGAKIVMQVHYFPSRVTGDDQTRIGLYFAKSKVEQRLFQIPIVNQKFKIQPGEEKHEVTATLTVIPLLTADAIWIYPHMHLLGREIKVEVTGLDRETRPMIYQNDWDFNWQGSYTYKEPMKLRAGDRIKLTCVFDNSENNPRNPNNPLIEVGWGEKTTDEMCLAFIGVTLDIEKMLGILR
jgi:hypothetical protein